MSRGRRATEAYVVETSTTRRVLPHERTEFWTDLVSSYHCALRFEYPHRKDFHGSAVRQRTATYQLVGWRSDEDLVTRTPQAIKTDSDEDYRLIFPVAGRMVIRHADSEVSLHPGRAGLTAMSQPFQLWQSRATEAFVMTIPRRDFDLRLNRREPHAAGLNLTTGLGRVIRDLAIALFQERNVLNRNQFDAICDRLVELVCMHLLGDNRPPTPGTLGELDAIARRYVRENADDQQLTPQSLAAALGWSLRQVQLALQETGTTPRQLIKDERLRIARERLQSRSSQESITKIAHQLGFSSTSAFSNAFRARYGIRPRDLR